MANIDSGEIGTIYKRTLGRLPTQQELSYWTSISHFDPRWDGGKAATAYLSATPEAQQFRATGISPSKTGGITGQTTPLNGTSTTAPSFAPPSSTPTFTSGSSTPTSPTTAIPPANAYSSIPFTTDGMPKISFGGGTGTGGVQYPTFSFDFANEQKDAYERLKPFYEKLLSFAGGRVDLAKRMLDFSYQQGMRESTGEAEQRRQELALTTPGETASLQTDQNRRGILTSGFGGQERERLKQSQTLRKEAIERALQDRERRLTAEKGFGIEEKSRGLEEETFDLERKRRQEASDLTSQKFQMRSAQYQGELAKAQQDEQRNIQRESTEAQKKYYESLGIKV